MSYKTGFKKYDKANRDFDRMFKAAGKLTNKGLKAILKGSNKRSTVSLAPLINLTWNIVWFMIKLVFWYPLYYTYVVLS